MKFGRALSLLLLLGALGTIGCENDGVSTGNINQADPAEKLAGLYADSHLQEIADNYSPTIRPAETCAEIRKQFGNEFKSLTYLRLEEGFVQECSILNQGSSVCSAVGTYSENVMKKEYRGFDAEIVLNKIVERDTGSMNSKQTAHLAISSSMVNGQNVKIESLFSGHKLGLVQEINDETINEFRELAEQCD